jgi:hypothetical protein
MSRYREGEDAVRRLLLGGVLIFLCARGAAAAERAELLLEQGVALFNAAEFERSLSTLRRARGLRDTRALGRAQLYIGLDCAFLGRARQAREAFVAALTHDPQLDVDPQRIRPDVAQTFRAVRQGLAGQLAVTADRADVTILLDGRVIGEAPLTLRVVIGAHRVEARAGGGPIAFRTTAVIGVNRRTEVEAVLRAQQRPPETGSISVRSTPSGAAVWIDGARVGRTPLIAPDVAAGEHQLVVRLGDRTERRQVRVTIGRRARVELSLSKPRGRIWTWIVAGTAVAFAGVALGVWRWGESEYAEYLKTEDRARFHELEESIPGRYRTAQALIGVAGGLAGTAIVLFFLEGRWIHAREHAASLRLDPMIGQASGAMLSGEF